MLFNHFKTRNIIGILFSISIVQACQTTQLAKTDGSSASFLVYQTESKTKVTDTSTNKFYSAKVIWYLKEQELLRIDLLGPFDILMAQAFVTQSKATLIDHRQKIIRLINQVQNLKIDGYELPVFELALLIHQYQPRQWTCQPNEFGKKNCRNFQLKSTWISPNELKIQDNRYLIEVMLLSSQIKAESETGVFQVFHPSNYQVIRD